MALHTGIFFGSAGMGAILDISDPSLVSHVQSKHVICCALTLSPTWLFYTLDMREMVWYLSFSVWLLLVWDPVVPCKFLQKTRFLFLDPSNSPLWIVHIPHPYLLTWHSILYCFQILTIVNNAKIKIGLNVSFVFLWFWSWIAVSDISSILFFENFHTILHRGWTSWYSHQ